MPKNLKPSQKVAQLSKVIAAEAVVLPVRARDPVPSVQQPARVYGETVGWCWRVPVGVDEVTVEEEEDVVDETELEVEVADETELAVVVAWGRG